MQRYFSTKKENDIFYLKEDDLYHITRVMRMKDQDEIEVVYDQNVYLCCLENVNTNLVVRVKKIQEKKADFMKEIVLAIPLLKEQKMDFILQKATELGVSKIVPILTERSIIKLEQGRENKKIDRWQKIVKEASEQSMRTLIPEVTSIKKIAELRDFDGLKLVCSTTEKENNVKNILNKNLDCDKIIVVIGPEGGLSKKEENQLVEIGFQKITLGPRIMRVETVPLFIMSVLNYQFME